VTDPTHDTAPEPPPWRLTLEHGDRIEVRPAEDTDGGSSEPQVVLTLWPYRSAELGVVLDRYNRLASIFAESSGIWTEKSLARGLRDAPTIVDGHASDQLVAVVDATAWWMDSDEDYKATDLLESVASTEVSSDVYLTLLDWSRQYRRSRPTNRGSPDSEPQVSEPGSTDGTAGTLVCIAPGSTRYSSTRSSTCRGADPMPEAARVCGKGGPAFTGSPPLPGRNAQLGEQVRRRGRCGPEQHRNSAPLGLPMCRGERGQGSTVDGLG
jgi:hypothetical protein